MSNEEIIAEIRRRPACCQDLTEELWNQNRGLIEKTIRRYAGIGEPDDMRQEAFLGLLDAVRRFDSERGTFLPCLAQAVRARLARYSTGLGPVRIPDSTYWKMVKLRQLRNSGEGLTKEALAEKTGINPAVTDFLLSERFEVALRLDAPVNAAEGGETGITLGQLLPGPDQPDQDVVEGTFWRQLRYALWEIMDGLPYGLSFMLWEYFWNGRTVEEIGAEVGITGSAAGRKIGQAVRAMGRGKARKQLLPFWNEIRDGGPDSTEQTRTEGLKGTGTNVFMRTWTSSTERAALLLVERREKQDGLQIHDGAKDGHSFEE